MARFFPTSCIVSRRSSLIGLADKLQQLLLLLFVVQCLTNGLLNRELKTLQMNEECGAMYVAVAITRQL